MRNLPEDHEDRRWEDHKELCCKDREDSDCEDHEDLTVGIVWIGAVRLRY